MDALSKIHPAQCPQSGPKPSCFVNAIMWDFDWEITYVPADSKEVSSCGLTPAVGHPGTRRTLKLLSAKYWCPNVMSEIHRYVASCSACARAKVPCNFRTGKLMSLPIPQHPWSHIALYFFTDLPEFQGNIVILVALDQFSCSLCLIPLPAIPTPFKTIELVFNHLFRYYSIPEDIISDRGVQFMSRVWSSFMDNLGGVGKTLFWLSSSVKQASRE